ncbi:acyltransferase family protein [Morganella morganii]|uniref:acyltransferase family protein n=1 Tax=Morganella morganii TaxID=582 RepID=UPI003CF806CC
MTRNINIDIIKFIMSLLVITIHFDYQSGQFITQFIINELSRAAVPFFFIISGFFLIPTVEKNMHVNWLIKILMIYISWSLVYFIYLKYFSNDRGGAYYLLEQITTGWYHLWYFPALIMGYIIAYHMRHRSLRSISSTIILLLSVLFYLQIKKYGDVSLISYRNFLFTAAPCIMSGLIIYRVRDMYTLKGISKTLPMITGAIIIISLISYNYGLIIEVPLSSLIMAILIVSITTKTKPLISHSKINISKLSTVIYLTHPLFIGLANTHNYIISYLLILTCCFISFVFLSLIKFKYI